MKKITAIGLFILLLGAHALPQSKFGSKPPAQKSYRLKYSLAFFLNCVPKVYPDNITFTESCVYKHDEVVYLTPNAEVVITAIKKQHPFSKITLKYAGSSYAILVKDDGQGDFEKGFSLLFSEKNISEELRHRCLSEVTTKEQVIQCLGFPIDMNNENGVEKYFYDMDFVGFMFSGFHSWWVEMKDKKVMSISGTI